MVKQLLMLFFMVAIVCFSLLVFNVPRDFGGLSRTTLKKVPVNVVIQSLRNTPRKSYHPNCKKLFAGDAREISKAFKSAEHVSLLADRSYINMTLDCSLFKKKMGYTVKRDRKKDHFSIAYSIKMHKAVAQVERLLHEVWRPEHVVCIYIDGKSNSDVHHAMNGIANCFENVFVSKNKERFLYQGASQMRADLHCMKELLETDVAWRYHLNLAGQEFPLQTNDEIVETLKVMNGSNDIDGHFADLRALDKNHFLYEATIVHSTTDGSYATLIREDSKKKKMFEYNITFYKGNDYNAFSREFVQFVLEDDVAKKFVRWISDLVMPEEIVWATLNRLPFAPGGYPDYYHPHLSRYINWLLETPEFCPSMYVREVCIFDVTSLPVLSNKLHLFANKFYSEEDPYVLECISELLRNRTHYPDVKRLTDIRTYVKSLPNVRHMKDLPRDRKKLYQVEKTKWVQAHKNEVQ